jgi:hypothetical protein
MSKKQTHMIDSSDPLRENETYVALCGETVSCAVFALKWIGGKLETEEFSTLMFCQKCLRARSPRALRFYTYGITERANVRHNGEDEAA